MESVAVVHEFGWPTRLRWRGWCLPAAAGPAALQAKRESTRMMPKWSWLL